MHPKVVSERLGHATVGITLDLYSHVLDGMQAEAAEQIGDVIFGSTAGPLESVGARGMPRTESGFVSSPLG